MSGIAQVDNACKSFVAAAGSKVTTATLARQLPCPGACDRARPGHGPRRRAGGLARKEFSHERISLLALLFSLSAGVSAQGQSATPATDRICIDVAHQPRFWRDPADMPGMDVKTIERVKYMTGELVKTATAVDASLSYLKKEVQPKDLEGCDLLFIHIPSTKYTPGEVSAISRYIAGGGSLFLVMDQDTWSTLEQTNVNDLIRPFGVQFGGESPIRSRRPHKRRTHYRQAPENFLSRREDHHRWHAVQLQ